MMYRLPVSLVPSIQSLSPSVIMVYTIHVNMYKHHFDFLDLRFRMRPLLFCLFSITDLMTVCIVLNLILFLGHTLWWNVFSASISLNFEFCCVGVCRLLWPLKVAHLSEMCKLLSQFYAFAISLNYIYCIWTPAQKRGWNYNAWLQKFSDLFGLSFNAS